MNRIPKFVLTCTLLFFVLFPAFGQVEKDSTLTLEQRYAEMLRKSESYQEYKVVKRSTLNLFWAALSDTVSNGSIQLKQALVDKMEMREQLSESRDSLALIQSQLQAQMRDKSTTSFLGFQLPKSVYNSLVWALILSFAGLMVYFMQRFRMGHTQVKETRQELEKLQSDFDNLRHRSKETQMKLKRELQTALNKLEMVDERM